MKKTITTLFICFGMLAVNGQSKPDSTKPSKADTLAIPSTAKVLVIGDKKISVELLKQDGIYVTRKDFDNLILLLQEFPAKCANPITEAVLRFFGLQVK